MAIETALVAIGKIGLSTAVDLGRKQLEAAEQEGRRNAAACIHYLTAASLAIRGLEDEYDEILVQARGTDWTKPADVRGLKTRIDHYMSVDQLRPILLDALTGIESCRNALQRDADSFWSFHKREERQDAIAHTVNVTEALDDYHQLLFEFQRTELDDNRGHHSGVGIRWLVDINDALGDPADGLDEERLARVRMLVDNASNDRTKGNLDRFISEIRRTIEKLRQYF
jgi:hypothetical protein